MADNDNIISREEAIRLIFEEHLAWMRSLKSSPRLRGRRDLIGVAAERGKLTDWWTLREGYRRARSPGNSEPPSFLRGRPSDDEPS